VLLDVLDCDELVLLIDDELVLLWLLALDVDDRLDALEADD